MVPATFPHPPMSGVEQRCSLRSNTTHTAPWHPALCFNSTSPAESFDVLVKAAHWRNVLLGAAMYNVFLATSGTGTEKRWHGVLRWCVVHTVADSVLKGTLRSSEAEQTRASWLVQIEEQLFSTTYGWTYMRSTTYSG